MSATSPTMRAIRLAAAVGIAVLLTGCASAQPGTAARLGDDSVTLRDIDAASVLLCEAVTPQLEGDSTQLAMKLPRTFTLSSWIERTIAEQVADAYDVTPGPTYEASIAELERSLGSVEPEPREAYVAASTAHAYRVAVLSEVARVQLRDDGLTAPSDDQVVERAEAIFASWPDTHELKIDPRFGIRFVDGRLTDIDTGLSYAVSDTAQAGAEPEPEAAYLASLAESQRCG